MPYVLKPPEKSIIRNLREKHFLPEMPQKLQKRGILCDLHEINGRQVGSMWPAGLQTMGPHHMWQVFQGQQVTARQSQLLLPRLPHKGATKDNKMGGGWVEILRLGGLLLQCLIRRYIRLHRSDIRPNVPIQHEIKGNRRWVRLTTLQKHKRGYWVDSQKCFNFQHAKRLASLPG